MRYEIVSLLLILIASSCFKSGEFFPDAVCIQNVTTIDAVNGLKKDQTVIIKKDRIVKVVASEDLILSPGNEIIDGTGKYLIPGLWDAHVHFAFKEELAPAMFDLFLAYGITSVRDTGGKIDFVKRWKDQANANPTDAPRVMIAGPLLDGMPNVYNGSSPSWPLLSTGLATVKDALQYVDYLDSIGVDLLKAYEMLSPEQFVAIAQHAKAKGLKVTGHVPLSMDVISASNAGLYSMEHLRNLEMSTASNAADLLEQRRQLLAAGQDEIGGVLRSNIHNAQRREAIQNADELQTDSVLSVLAKNKTWQIPTLSIMTNIVERPFASDEWQASFNYLPEELEKKWRDDVINVLAVPPTDDKILYVNWIFEMTKKVHEAEIGILAGTDCPIFLLTPGLSLHGELELLVKAGLSPMDAIEAATLNPARYFEMQDSLGLIAEQMLADLVLLDANPLENISNTKKINAIVRNGKYYSRQALDEKLEKLDKTY